MQLISRTVFSIGLLLATMTQGLAQEAPSKIDVAGVSSSDYLFKDIRSSTQTADIGDGVLVYGITLFARWSDANRGGPGHAYVVMSEWRQQGGAVFWVHPQIFGMNPDFDATLAAGALPTGSGLIYNFIAKQQGAEGVLMDENPTVAIQLWVDREDYLRVAGLIDTWKQKNYTLLLNDCLAFVREAASTLGLTVPLRLADYPVTHLKEIQGLNQ